MKYISINVINDSTSRRDATEKIIKTDFDDSHHLNGVYPLTETLERLIINQIEQLSVCHNEWCENFTDGDECENCGRNVCKECEKCFSCNGEM